MLQDIRRHWLLLLVAGLVAGALLTAPVRAGDEEDEDDEETPAAAAPSDEQKPDFPPLAEVTKDMKLREGFFSYWHDEKKDKLLLRVPSDTLGKPFLLATSIARGPYFAGWMWMDSPVYWERMDKRLVLVAADPRYAKAKDKPVGDAISRTYTDVIVATVPIVTEADGDPVIDANALFKTDLIELSMIFGGRMDGQLSRYGALKNFPENTNIAVNAAMMGATPAGGGPIVQVYYCLSKLPENNGYQPREADNRVGYFLTAVKDWTTPHDESTIFKRYVNRWHLRKAEPDQEVSDVLPGDQIVFYIEKTVPVPYRRYVREGILEWNKAFEKAGLRNAVAVREQTDSNEYKDIDPEDVRYNFFRWIVSGDPFAMGPSRVNPYTGQILDADIIFDDSMVRYLIEDFEISGPKALRAYTDRRVEELIETLPQWQPPQSVVPPLAINDPVAAHWPDAEAALERILEDEPDWGRRPVHADCEIGIGAVRQLGFAALNAQHAGMDKLPEEFIGQAIKEIVMHEVGHTLGLRHNFKASSWKSLSEMRGAAAGNGDSATVGSVMDYNANMFAATPEEQALFITPTIGPYDEWAIEYGYRPFTAPKDGEGPKDEAELLTAIAARSAEPGLDYATDEDTSDIDPDPTVNRWDAGTDPIEFARYRIESAKRLWQNGLTWSVEDGKSWVRARRALDRLLGEYGFGAIMASRLVGGQYLHRDHKAAPNARDPIVPVPAERQREALRFLSETILACDGLNFPPETLNYLAAGRWGHWDSDGYDGELPFDLHGRIRGIHSWVLFQLMNPWTAERIYNAPLTTPKGQEPFTVSELHQTLTAAIWSELDKPAAGNANARQPLISSFRRALQRDHVGQLIEIVASRDGGWQNPDVQAIARITLKDLSARIDGVLKSRGDGLDEYTLAHLTDSKSRIDRALSAEYLANERSARGQGTIIIIGQEGEDR